MRRSAQLKVTHNHAVARLAINVRPQHQQQLFECVFCTLYTRSQHQYKRSTQHNTVKMFPVDTIPAHYYEERQAADQAKRLAKLQEQQIQERAQAAQKAAHPQNLTQALLQRPPLSRPVSSSVLGNIFQGFVKAASQQNSPVMSPAMSPATTPSAKVMTREEHEALIAEKKRDGDIVS